MLKNTRIGTVVALLMGLMAWLLIIYKAAIIPVTHDEVATMVHYLNFSTWEIMMYPDPWPNNHILNTLLAKYSMAIFGVEQWSARLPNVLSFLLYFYAAFRICRMLFSQEILLFLSGIVLFIANPFLLDFFSLCRGYGMSNALMLAAAMFCLEGFMKQQEQALWWSLGFAILAAYANFTMLIFWCAINGMLFFYFLDAHANAWNLRSFFTKIGIQLIGALAFLALIFTPIQKMQSTDQFVYWQSNSFFQDTIVSLVENTRYGSVVLDIPNAYWALAVTFAYFAAGAYVMFYWGKTTRRTVFAMPLFISFNLISLTIFADILQTIILHTPNLTTRTALLYYPLFAFLLASSLQHFHIFQAKTSRWIAGGTILIAILHMSRTVSLDRVREWWYDANTFQVQEILHEKSKNNPVSLQVSWFFHPSFNFYYQHNKTPWIELQPYNKEIDTTAQPHFYYIFDSDYPLLQDQYDVIEKFDGGSRLLLQRHE